MSFFCDPFENLCPKLSIARNVAAPIVHGVTP